MALRDQPYFPLYVQDYMTDEKLNMCDWATQGIYIKILCVLHKQDVYGKILFKQNSKQNRSSIEYFASVLVKQIPCQIEDMIEALKQLTENGVMIIDDESLYQKRMVRDGQISEARSTAGKKGGGNPILFKQNSKQRDKQRDKQNTEYENEYKEEKGIEGLGEKEKETNPKNLEFDRFNNWIDEKIPYLRKIRDQITFEQYCSLTEKYNGEQIRYILTALANYKDAPKKYVSVNLTFQKWAKKEYNG